MCHFKEQKHLNVCERNLSWERVTKITSPKIEEKNIFLLDYIFPQINHVTMQWCENKFYFLHIYRYSKTINNIYMKKMLENFFGLYTFGWECRSKRLTRCNFSQLCRFYLTKLSLGFKSKFKPFKWHESWTSSNFVLLLHWTGG